MSGRLNNEQFYDALRKATTALDLNFAAAAEAFWFSWNPPYRQGDYVALDSCAKPGRKDECTGDFVGKAVYEQRTDRIYFAFSTASAPPDCKAANGRDPIDAALGGVHFFPPRFRWQPAALAVLKDLYCPGIHCPGHSLAAKLVAPRLPIMVSCIPGVPHRPGCSP